MKENLKNLGADINENLKAVFLLRDQDRNNVLINASGNKNISTIQLVIEIARNLLGSADFSDDLILRNQSWVVDALCQYAFLAESEAFQMFWSWLSENLTKYQRKIILLQKKQYSMNSIMSSTRSKHKMAVETVFNMAKRLVGSDELAWLQNSEDNNWLVDYSRRYAFLGESEAFGMVWSSLHENFEQNDQNLLTAQKKKNGTNALMSAAENKDQFTAELVIEAARGILGFEDFSAAVNSEDENWVVDALCRYALLAESKAFEKFWLFMCEKVGKDVQKSMLLKKKINGINALMASAENRDKSTVKLVINAARNLMTFDDFTTALESEDQNWIVDTLGRYSLLSDAEAFEIFWSFLQENLENLDRDQKEGRKRLKKVFLQNSQNGRCAFSTSARNKKKSTVDLVIKTARSLIDQNDFKEAVKFGDSSWLVDTLCQYAFRAEAESFEMLWSFVQENLNADERRLVFLQKDRSEDNTIMACAENNFRSTIELVFTTATSLFTPEDFAEALSSNHENWVLDTLCQYTAFGSPEIFELFWKVLIDNLEEDDQKRVLLQNNQSGNNALMCSAFNKNKLTIKLVLNLYRKFFSDDNLRDCFFVIFSFNHSENFDQFDIEIEDPAFVHFLQENYQNRKLTLALTHVVNSKDGITLWDITLKHLVPEKIKELLLDKDSNGNNAFSNACLRNRLILLVFLDWFKDNYRRWMKVIFEENNNKFETLLHMAALHCDESLCQKLFNFIEASFKESEIKKILSKLNIDGENPLSTSQRNKPAVFQMFNNYYCRYS